MAEQEKLAQLIVQMELQSAAFERGVKDMARKMDRLDNQTKKTNRAFARFDKTLSKIGKSFVGLAASIGLLGLANAAKEAVQFADSLAKTADKVGVSVDALQKLRFAAEQSGVNTNTLDMALQRFARRAGEAANGTGELVKEFDALGISTDNADGTIKTTEELLYEYADAIGNATSQQEKLRLAFKGFDSEGAALVNLFRNGSEEVRALGKELEDLGGIIGEDTARKAEELNDKFNELSTIVGNNVKTAFIEAAGAVAEFFGYFSDLEGVDEEIDRVINELLLIDQKLNDSNLRVKSPLLLRKQALLDELATLEARADELRKKVNGGDQDSEESGAAVLKRDLTGIDDLLDGVGAKMRSVGEAVDGVGAAALKLSEPDSFFGKDGFLDQLSKMNEAAAPVYDFAASLDNLADIGVTFGETEEAGTDMFEKLIEATDGFAREFTQTMTNALLEGEASFDDFAKNILKTIADILLTEIFSQFFTAIAGGVKGFFGAPTASSPDTRIAAYAPMSMPSITREGDVSPSMIVGRVQPSTGFVSTSSSPVTVNVNNYGNDEVSVAERRDSNGGIEIDVLIKQTVKQGFSNGDFDRALNSNFGTRRLGY